MKKELKDIIHIDKYFYYIDNREEILQKKREYFQKNKEKILLKKRIRETIQRNNLTDEYLIKLIHSKYEIPASLIKDIPFLIETQRNIIKVKQQTKKINNYGKQNRKKRIKPC